MSLDPELEQELESLHSALHREGVLLLVGAGLSAGLPSWSGVLLEQVGALPEAERADLEAAAAAGHWADVADALEGGRLSPRLAERLRAAFAAPAATLPAIFAQIARLPADVVATTAWDSWLKEALGERPVQVLPLLGNFADPASLRFLPTAPSAELERQLSRRRLLVLAESLSDPDLTTLFEVWAPFLSRKSERHLVLAHRADKLARKRWQRWGFAVIESEDCDEVLLRLARSPGEAQPKAAPRVLLAGPHFALTAEQARQVRKVWQEGGEGAGASAVEYLRSFDEVAREQVAALACFDFVFDFSPWRAFSRWFSRGAGDVEREQSPEAPAQICFAADFPERAGFEAWQLGFPDRVSRFEHAAAKGIAFAGFSPAEEQNLASWPELRGCRPLGDCAARELGLAEYRRALQVVAGQVRLLGDEVERPLQEVFVDLELEAVEVQAKRDVEEKEENRAELELEEVLKLRRETQRLPGAALPQRLQPLALASLSPKVFVFGLPGTGKTTLLKWLACRLASEGDRLPIWIRLADLASGDPEKMVEQALHSARLPDEAALRSALRRRLAGDEPGGVLLLLDGFDEANNLVREGLLGWLARLGPNVAMVLSSRPTPREVEALPGQFRSVRLGGLLPGGAETFLRSYFDAAPWISNLIRDLHQMPEGTTWLKTPILLSLAAILYRRDRVLPEATLELYEAVVAELFAMAARRARLLPDKIAEARATLEDFAQRKLFPGGGHKAAVVFARGELAALPGYLLIERSGLLAGGDQLRFAHLTLGEYLAACRLKLELPETAKEGALELEVLPMGLALAGEGGLESWWQAAKVNAEPWAFLALLRALALGGPSVLAFASRCGEKVLQEVVHRLMPQSGRLAATELEVAQWAEKAILGIRKNLPAGVWQLFGELAKSTGKLGFEGMILQRRAGAEDGRPLAATRLNRVRAAQALLNGKLSAKALERPSGELAPFVRAAAVWALAAVPGARQFIQAKLDDDAWNVRAAAVQALAAVPEARLLIQARLDDDEPYVRAAAVEALAAMPEARLLIRAKLEDDELLVRAAAVEALASVPEARHLIHARLDDDEPYVRATAVEALASVPEARQLIQSKLDDSNYAVRAAAVEALASVPEARQLIRAKLDDDEPDVRAAAVEALASVPGARHLIQAKLDDEPYVRAAAVEALAAVPEARQLVLANLDDDDPYVRAVAVEALASVPEARQLIQAKLDDDEPEVRAAAVEALASVPEARHLIQAKLDDDKPYVRAAAVHALAAVPEARLLIQAKLDDVEPDVRAAAVEALAAVPEARLLIQAKLDDSNYAVRAAAVVALAAVPEARHLIQAKLDDDDPYFRAAAVQALAAVPEALQLIQAKLDDGNPYVRAAAVQALAALPEARHLIQAKLDDSNYAVRAAAVQALAAVPEARQLIQAKLDDGNPYVRAAAVQALAAVPEARQLIQAKLDDEEPAVRAAAVQALAAVPEARQLIQAKLDDANYAVRAAAVRALQQQGYLAQDGKSPDLRLPLHASHRDPRPGQPFSREELWLEERLGAFLDSPSTLHLGLQEDLAAALLDWLVVRLGWASASAKWPGEGRFFGELRVVQEGETTSRQLRVAMLDSDLWPERRLPPSSNLLEAWKIASHLRTDQPFTFWLICADLDWSCFKLPELAPGELHFGPTYYGFRLLEAKAEGEKLDLLTLAASSDARQLWQVLPSSARARFLFELSALPLRSDFSPWAFLPLLAAIGDQLPPNIRQAFAAKLPRSAAAMADLLGKARNALGGSTEAFSDLPSAEAGSKGDARLIEIFAELRAFVQVEEPKKVEMSRAVALLSELARVVQKVEVEEEQAREVLFFFDRARDRAREVEWQENLKTALNLLPMLSKQNAWERKRKEIRHLINVFLKSRR